MLNRRQGLKTAMAMAGMAATGKTALAAVPTVIALSEQRNRFLIEVEIDGAAGYRFVLDTGASAHFISTRLVERLGLRQVEQRMVRGHSGRRREGVVDIRSLKAGGIELGRTRAIAWSPERLEDHDGLIGYPFLAPHAMVNLGQSRLSLGAQPSEALTAVKAQVMRNQALLIGGLAGAEGRFVFDTGAQNFTISPAYFQRIAGTDAYLSATKLVNRRPDGSSEVVAFRPAELAFGDFRIVDPTVRVGQADSREGVFDDVDGLFGVNLIRRYAWMLDQTARSLRAGPFPA